MWQVCGSEPMTTRRKETRPPIVGYDRSPVEAVKITDTTKASHTSTMPLCIHRWSRDRNDGEPNEERNQNRITCAQRILLRHSEPSSLLPTTYLAHTRLLGLPSKQFPFHPRGPYPAVDERAEFQCLIDEVVCSLPSRCISY